MRQQSGKTNLPATLSGQAVTAPDGQGGLTISATALKSVQDDFARRLISESKNAPSILQHLKSAVASVDLPYINAEGVQASVQSINQKLGLLALRTRAAGFDVRPAELQALTVKPYNAPVGSPLATFLAQYDLTVTGMTTALVEPTLKNQGDVRQAAALTRDEFVAIWPSIRNNPEARSIAVHRLDSLRAQSPLKATYGLPSTFDPVVYRAIFQQSRRAVSLNFNGEVRCSGILINAEWVLTAGHCMANQDPGSVQVVADLANDGSLTPIPTDDIWPRSGSGEADQDGIDFAFLHLRPESGASASLSTLLQAAPLCFEKTELGYQNPVIVIGYQTNNPAKVYDDAYVWFPFRVGANAFKQLSADTGAKLQRLAEAYYPDSQQNQLKMFENDMSSFEQAYVLAADGMTWLYQTPRGQIAKRSYFGMDTDTVHGNSGAPVFTREDAQRAVCVAGVFDGGSRTTKAHLELGKRSKRRHGGLRKGKQGVV